MFNTTRLKNTGDVITDKRPKKSTLIERSTKTKIAPPLYTEYGTVHRPAHLEGRMKRVNVEPTEKRKDMGSTSSLSSSDLSKILSETDSSSSDSSDSCSSDSDISSSLSHNGDIKNVRNIADKIKKLKAKQKAKLEETYLQLITEQEKLENKKWKRKELYVDQELYNRHKANRHEIMVVGGPENWIKLLFQDVNAGRRMEGNIVWKMVQKFSLVMFVKDINKITGKCSEIIENTRAKHNIDEDEILELVLDDSHAGKLTYIDLQKLTKRRTLPQIFVNETYIGGLAELKDLAAKGLLLRQILVNQGIVDKKCDNCIDIVEHVRLATL